MKHCSIFKRPLEKEIPQASQLHIPVSIKLHCLKNFPSLLSKTLIQKFKPVASCLVPDGDDGDSLIILHRSTSLHEVLLKPCKPEAP